MKQPEGWKPEEYFPKDHPRFPGAKRCEQWITKKGRQCENPAKIDRIKCRSHGGNTPRGRASPHFKTGKYSKDFLANQHNLKALYEKHLADIDLSLRENIALIDTLLSEQLQNLDGVPLKQHLDKIRQNFKAMQVAAYSNDEVKYRAAEKKLEQAINSALSQAATRDQVVKLSDERRKLAESERKYQIEQETMLTLEQWREFFSVQTNSVIDIIERYCDPTLARTIMGEMESLNTRLLTGGNVIQGAVIDSD